MTPTDHDNHASRQAPSPPTGAPSRGPVDDAGEEPVHPHPLSNDLTEEPLPSRSEREEVAAKTGIGATPRRLVVVVGGIALCLVAVGLIGSAAMLGERWQLVALGAIIAVAAVIIMSMPILLGAGTKVAQDEAVRDAKTPTQSLARTPGRKFSTNSGTAPASTPAGMTVPERDGQRGTMPRDAT